MSDTHGAQAAGNGADGAAAAAAAAAAAGANGAGAKPWFEGKADVETIGYFQNRGWDKLDPVAAAIEASKAHREAQKHLGVPADQLIRIPKDAKDEAGWNALHQRLGAPKEAKEYNFSDVKLADGTALDDSYADAIRNAAFKNHIPKDAAADFARSLLEHAKMTDQTDADNRAALIAADKQALEKNWGPNFARNRQTALQGANRLGFSDEEFAALEEGKNVGTLSRVMEMFRTVGANTSEDTFVEGHSSSSMATLEGAYARRAELLNDKAWVARHSKGGASERVEMQRLNKIIADSK